MVKSPPNQPEIDEIDEINALAETIPRNILLNALKHIVETSANPQTAIHYTLKHMKTNPQTAMHCPQCNAIMTETIEDYSFYHRTNDSDTHRSVTLSNMRINRCRCGETTVTIPKIEELHGFLDSNPNATLLTYGPTTWH